jgi:hypothetical protein
MKCKRLRITLYAVLNGFSLTKATTVARNYPDTNEDPYLEYHHIRGDQK